MSHLHRARSGTVLLAAVAIALAATLSAAAPAATGTATAQSVHVSAVKRTAPPSGATPARSSPHASAYYAANWGVEALSVKLAESGELIRFSWRVLDPALAAVLSDDKLQPSLEDPQAGVSLVIPTMENIGQLRQTQRPEAGRSYWMTFSNSGRPVKSGHRVNIVIGAFRANGLITE